MKGTKIRIVDSTAIATVAPTRGDEGVVPAVVEAPRLMGAANATPRPAGVTGVQESIKKYSNTLFIVTNKNTDKTRQEVSNCSRNTKINNKGKLD